MKMTFQEIKDFLNEKIRLIDEIERRQTDLDQVADCNPSQVVVYTYADLEYITITEGKSLNDITKTTKDCLEKEIDTFTKAYNKGMSKELKI